MKGLNSEGLMGAVAQRTLLGMFAGAEIDRAVRVGRVRNRRESGTLVGAVAEGLVLALAARAPVIGLTGFDEDRDGRLLGDVRSGHGKKMTEGR